MRFSPLYHSLVMGFNLAWKWLQPYKKSLLWLKNQQIYPNQTFLKHKIYLSNRGLWRKIGCAYNRKIIVRVIKFYAHSGFP